MTDATALDLVKVLAGTVNNLRADNSINREAKESLDFTAKFLVEQFTLALAQARKETWEQAAREVENGRFLTNESPEYNFGQKAAAMLRRKAQEVPL